jgi:hypothetical protein
MPYSEGLVVFIDIQGTKSKKDFNTKFEQHSVFHTQARRTEEREGNYNKRTLNRKVFNFSDCAYFIFTWNDRASDERKSSPLPILEALSTLLIPVQILMNRGFLVRGGAVWGDVYYDQYGAFGPAMEEAYKIESQQAFYPRVMIERDLGERLYKFEEEEYNKLDESLADKSEEIRDAILPKQALIKLDDYSYYLNSFANLETPGTLEGEYLSWDIFQARVIDTIQEVRSTPWRNF